MVFDRTYDTNAIARAGGGLLRTDSDLEPLMRWAARLTAHSWRYRYPGEPFDPPAAEIAEAIATATEVVDTLESTAMRPD